MDNQPEQITPPQPTSQPEPVVPTTANQPAEIPQEQPTNTETSAPSASVEPAKEDPGHKLGIIALVFAFLFAPVGLIMSIVALVKSRKARAKNPLAIVGLVLSIVFTILIVGTVSSITIATFSKVSTSANAISASSSATSVSQTAIYYWGMAGYYPDEIADFSSTELLGKSTLPNTINLVGSPSKINENNGKNTVSYEYCGPLGKASGGRIQYWNYDTNKLGDYTYVGTASSSTVCYPAK